MAKRFEKAKYYTEKYQKTLAHCRFCGNSDIRVVSDRTIFPPKDGWSICCSTNECDATGVYTSVKKAIEVWNRRSDNEQAKT